MGMQYRVIRALQSVALESPPHASEYYGAQALDEALVLTRAIAAKISPRKAALILLRAAPGYIQTADAAYYHGLSEPSADAWRARAS